MFCMLVVTMATTLSWRDPPRPGYVVFGTGARIVPALKDTARPRVRSEIISGGTTSFVEETPDEIAAAAAAQCGARIAKVRPPDPPH